MQSPIEALSLSIVAIMYVGDVVFAVSGALTAARHRMDALGIVLIGVVTGIGGGTLRDMLLGHPVWWVHNPTELILCAVAAFVTYFFRRVRVRHAQAATWADALGLAAFAVVGAHIALKSDVSVVVAAFLGMLTATGGGVIRDVLTQTRPMIMSGEIYATAAIVGATVYAGLSHYGLTEGVAGPAAFGLAFAVRAAAIIFNLRFGVAGESLVVMGRRQQS